MNSQRHVLTNSSVGHIPRRCKSQAKDSESHRDNFHLGPPYCDQDAQWLNNVGSIYQVDPKQIRKTNYSSSKRSRRSCNIPRDEGGARLLFGWEEAVLTAEPNNLAASKLLSSRQRATRNVK